MQQPEVSIVIPCRDEAAISPTRLFLVPGLVLLLLGVALELALLPGLLTVAGFTMDFHFMFVGGAVAILGTQLLLLGVYAKTLEDPSVAGVYGRQVPRDATTMEMFFVSLNYPPEPLRYEPTPDGHHPRPGRVVFSNAFSAVRREVALEIPIPEDADYSEDQIWARKALAAGYAVVYEPGAEALHAHSYRLRGVSRRSFFVGRALRSAGIDRGASFVESVKFLAGEVAYFVRQGHIHRLPQLLPYEFLRWLGFHVGRLSGGRGASTVGWSAGGGER